MFFLFDPLYIVLIVATLVISGGAQLYIRSTYGKWDRVPNRAVFNGAQVAEVLRDRARFGNGTGQQAITAIQVVQGHLSDHFDPRDRSLSLSQAVATQPSVASMAIAAHEVGHAQQLAEGSACDADPVLLVPAATHRPADRLSVHLWRVDLPTSRDCSRSASSLFGIAVLFSLLTLPVEIQASQKALAMLRVDGHHHDAAGARSARGRC